MAKTKVYTMTKEIKCLTEHDEWRALSRHQQDIAGQHMRDWFHADQSRFSRYSIHFGNLLLDYSRNRVNDETIQLLCQLAQSNHLPEKIAALCSGQTVNMTEKRAALHTALRDKNRTPIIINGENIAALVAQALDQMREFTQQIHSENWKGITGKPIKHIVTLGVGGSYLGTTMCCHALKDFAVAPLQFHFISSVDKSLTNDVLKQIDPEATLFIVSSKTFTTLETMTNANSLLLWMQNKLGKNVIKHHFIGITANKEKALAFGLPKENIFPLWDWVGGRYSIWSAIGLPLMLMIGSQSFNEFLDGAFQMDQHFQTAEFSKNMPALLALLNIWYMNFFNATAQAIVPYSHRLRHLIPYLQQADMESNGKLTRLNGESIRYATGPVIFGEEGCNGQHSYHQLLHQGQHLIPVDFILIGKTAHNTHDHHQDILVASGLSQAQALML
jgi:glucose-6-phosphate isomerase